MTKKKSIQIDRESYIIKEVNYYKEEYKKSLIILGGTNRIEDFYLKRQLKKDNKKAKDWNTYTISRNGVIYEHYNPIYYSEFTGDNIIDRKSVSILLENMGHLYYNDEMDIYVNDLNEVLENNDLIFTKEWRGYKYYESYTKEQYDATVYLCRLLCLELNINDDSIGHNAFDDNAKNYTGVISRSNLDVNNTDLNPSFDFKKFLKDLKK